MPFGNAPATFQCLMETVLAGLARLVHGVPGRHTCRVKVQSFAEHLHNLRQQVFSRLHEARLWLKPRKCRLAMHSVEYLGYVVSSEGIAANPRKVAAAQSFPVPEDLKALRSSLLLQEIHPIILQSCCPSLRTHQERHPVPVEC
jgi:hypothetical protein